MQSQSQHSENSLNSNENKALLWNLLNESNIFTNIPDQFLNNVKVDFEDIILKHKNNNNGKQINLMEQNKKIITDIIPTLNKYKLPSALKQNIPSALKQNIPLPNQDSNSSVYTQQQIHEERQEKFHSQLSEKETEFSSLIKKKTPNKIDFSDKNDEPIGNQMDDLLTKALQERDNQLEGIQNNMTPTSDIKKWIGNKEANISIGENLPIQKNQAIDINNNAKKVHFANNLVDNIPSDHIPSDHIPSNHIPSNHIPSNSSNSSNSSNNFLQKLKLNNENINQKSADINNNELKVLLQQVLTNQEQILKQIDNILNENNTIEIEVNDDISEENVEKLHDNE